jgi:endonuclease/exonuclease/phosphatase family metal-dependent hydrolase
VPRLVVATFNVLHGMSLSTGVSDPDRLCEAVAGIGADVLALQEVDCGQTRSGGAAQAALVARAIGAPHWRFVPTLVGTPGRRTSWEPASWVTGGDGDRHLGGGADAGGPPAYGIALLSRLPVRTWFVRRFPPAPVPFPLLLPTVPRPRLALVPDEPRAAVAAVVDTAAGPVTVVACHLSFVPGVNVLQLRAIARWLRAAPAPHLLIGDLNLPGRLPARISGLTPLVSAPTYPSPQPRVQLDHVLADRTAGARGHVDRGAPPAGVGPPRRTRRARTRTPTWVSADRNRVDAAASCRRERLDQGHERRFVQQVDRVHGRPSRT